MTKFTNHKDEYSWYRILVNDLMFLNVTLCSTFVCKWFPTERTQMTVSVDTALLVALSFMSSSEFFVTLGTLKQQLIVVYAGYVVV